MQRYNIALNPELSLLELGTIALTSTNHARHRAAERAIPLPTGMNIFKGSVVELEAEGKVLNKIIVRVSESKNSLYDLVYVLGRTRGTEWSIISCYKNLKTDNHISLNLTRFD